MEETMFKIKNFLKEYNDLESSTTDLNLNPKIISNYALNREDVSAQVIDWILHYIEDRKFPYNLAVAIAKETAEHIDHYISEQQLKENSVEEKLLNSLALYNEAVKNVLPTVCRSYVERVDESELSCFKSPYSASVFAVKNKRRKMEDRHAIHHDLNLFLGLKDAPSHSYYAVFDGHAGVDAASYASAHLHINIANHPAFLSDTPTAISEAFKITDENFIKNYHEENLKSGTTAVCALIREKTVFLSWVGDSQAVLVKEGKPVIVTSPHKPDREDEQKRIESLGGSIMCIGTLRVNGMLAVTRAIGDADHKPLISSEPEITAINLDGAEDFLILACDGLWDVMSPEDVIGSLYYNLLESNLDEPLDTVAAKLVHQSKLQGSEDNITAVVVFLKDIKEIKKDAGKYVPNLSKANLQMNFFEVNGGGNFCTDGSSGVPLSKPTVLELNSSSVKKLKNTADVLNAAGLGDSSLSYSFSENTDSMSYHTANIENNSQGHAVAPETTALSELPTPPIDDMLSSQQFKEVCSATLSQELDSVSQNRLSPCDNLSSPVKSPCITSEESDTDDSQMSQSSENVVKSTEISPDEAVDIASTVVSNTIETAVKCISEKEENESKIHICSQKLNPFAEPFVMKSFIPNEPVITNTDNFFSSLQEPVPSAPSYSEITKEVIPSEVESNKLDGGSTSVSSDFPSFVGKNVSQTGVSDISLNEKESQMLFDHEQPPIQNLLSDSQACADDFENRTNVTQSSPEIESPIHVKEPEFVPNSFLPASQEDLDCEIPFDIEASAKNSNKDLSPSVTDDAKTNSEELVVRNSLMDANEVINLDSEKVDNSLLLQGDVKDVDLFLGDLAVDSNEAIYENTSLSESDDQKLIDQLNSLNINQIEKNVSIEDLISNESKTDEVQITTITSSDIISNESAETEKIQITTVTSSDMINYVDPSLSESDEHKLMEQLDSLNEIQTNLGPCEQDITSSKITEAEGIQVSNILSNTTAFENPFVLESDEKKIMEQLNSLNEIQTKLDPCEKDVTSSKITDTEEIQVSNIASNATAFENPFVSESDEQKFVEQLNSLNLSKNIQDLDKQESLDLNVSNALEPRADRLTNLCEVSINSESNSFLTSSMLNEADSSTLLIETSSVSAASNFLQGVTMNEISCIQASGELSTTTVSLESENVSSVPSIILEGLSLPLTGMKESEQTTSVVLPSDQVEESQVEAVAVDLQAIPVGVPEAEGVTEDVDSDSEKDGGWSYMKGNTVGDKKNKSVSEKSAAKTSNLKSKKEPTKPSNESRSKITSLANADKSKKTLPDKKVSEVRDKNKGAKPLSSSTLSRAAIDKPKVSSSTIGVKKDISTTKSSTLTTSKISRSTASTMRSTVTQSTASKTVTQSSTVQSAGTSTQSKTGNILNTIRSHVPAKPAASSTLKPKTNSGIQTTIAKRQPPSNQSTKLTSTAARTNSTRPPVSTVPTRALSAVKPPSLQKPSIAESKSKPASSTLKKINLAAPKKPADVKEITNKQVLEKKSTVPKVPSKGLSSNASGTLKPSTISNKLASKPRSASLKTETLKKDVPKAPANRLPSKSSTLSKATKDIQRAATKNNLPLLKRVPSKKVEKQDKSVAASTPSSEEEKFLREVNDKETPVKELIDISADVIEEKPSENGCASEEDIRKLEEDVVAKPIESLQ